MIPAALKRHDSLDLVRLDLVRLDLVRLDLVRLDLVRLDLGAFLFTIFTQETINILPTIILIYP
ncbi:hypothetical protein GCM10007877_19410 [Marinibactrum halimedae]|uniref:Uncharacterized protein n=1 Tax=Marinibactrum halimedae TaxID=1444977 RepID=A0AA37WNL5_9GAMM|nr:hypothetical protein GCM10007877_19410 [Marinibactrum halimedae]